MNNRFDVWIDFLDNRKLTRCLEIGVWKGAFAQFMNDTFSISEYIGVDPYRMLTDWNKPLNNTELLENALREASGRDFWNDHKRIERTTSDESNALQRSNYHDFIYIDGDHTLRGIMIDLELSFRATKDGGVIGGDDFTEDIFQHGLSHEPTMVSYVVQAFAESKKCPLYRLPFGQFAIIKDHSGFVMNGKRNKPLNEQFSLLSIMKHTIKDAVKRYA